MGQRDKHTDEDDDRPLDLTNHVSDSEMGGANPLSPSKMGGANLLSPTYQRPKTPTIIGAREPCGKPSALVGGLGNIRKGTKPVKMVRIQGWFARSAPFARYVTIYVFVCACTIFLTA